MYVELLMPFVLMAILLVSVIVLAGVEQWRSGGTVSFGRAFEDLNRIKFAGGMILMMSVFAISNALFSPPTSPRAAVFVLIAPTIGILVLVWPITWIMRHIVFSGADRLAELLQRRAPRPAQARPEPSRRGNRADIPTTVLTVVAATAVFTGIKVVNGKSAEEAMREGVTLLVAVSVLNLYVRVVMRRAE